MGDSREGMRHCRRLVAPRSTHGPEHQGNDDDPALLPPAAAAEDVVRSGPGAPTERLLPRLVSYVVNSWAANYPGQVKLSDVFTPKGVAAASG